MRSFRLKTFSFAHPLVLGGRRHVGEDISPLAIGASGKISGTGRYKKKRLSWGSSASPDVAGYRIYWAMGKEVGYDSDFLDVGNVTSVILPDDIACFSGIRGLIEIGVTAVGSGGNESDMSVWSAFFDFSRPEEPTNLRFEDL
jgi:hypothetical protein